MKIEKRNIKPKHVLREILKKPLKLIGILKSSNIEELNPLEKEIEKFKKIDFEKDFIQRYLPKIIDAIVIAKDENKPDNVKIRADFYGLKDIEMKQIILESTDVLLEMKKSLSKIDSRIEIKGIEGDVKIGNTYPISIDLVPLDSSVFIFIRVETIIYQKTNNEETIIISG